MTDINQMLERMRKREADYATEWCGYGHDDDVREANADIRALLAHIESLTALADQRGRDLVALSGLFDRRYCTGYECLAEKPDPYCKDCNEITAIRERNPDLFKGE